MLNLAAQQVPFKALAVFNKPLIACYSKAIKPLVNLEELVPKLKPNHVKVAVLSRRFQPPLVRKNGTPKPLREIHYVYERIMDPVRRPFPDVDIILIKNVTGVGAVGTKLRMKGTYAYESFLLPKLAIYASPENEERYAAMWEELRRTQVQFSSLSAELIVNSLQRMMLILNMNLDAPWEVEKWHVRVAFRRMGVSVPDECIELPSKLIVGPDINKEGKHFFITVIINNHERVPVVCRLNHFTTDDMRMFPVYPPWTEPFLPLFDEDSEKLISMKRPAAEEKTTYFPPGYKPLNITH